MTPTTIIAKRRIAPPIEAPTMTPILLAGACGIGFGAGGATGNGYGFGMMIGFGTQPLSLAISLVEQVVFGFPVLTKLKRCGISTAL
jgi:hypothetical protein